MGDFCGDLSRSCISSGDPPALRKLSRSCDSTDLALSTLVNPVVEPAPLVSCSLEPPSPKPFVDRISSNESLEECCSPDSKFGLSSDKYFTSLFISRSIVFTSDSESCNSSTISFATFCAESVFVLNGNSTVLV